MRERKRAVYEYWCPQFYYNLCAASAVFTCHLISIVECKQDNFAYTGKVEQIFTDLWHLALESGWNKNFV